MELDPARRERILNAAARMIVANGLQSSMSAIAESAGVATGSVYNYFKSKEDLIWGVYRRLSETICSRLVREWDDNEGPKDRILHYIYDYIDFIWEDRDRAILFEYLSSVPLIAPSELYEVFGEVTHYSVRLMADGRDAKLLLELPPATMSSFIGGGIRNALKWRRIDPAALSENERQHIAKMCWSAISGQPFGLRNHEDL
jgi:AcrR family transcriptional regulator